MTRPSTDKHWGWCQSWCIDFKGQSMASKLQETKLDLLRQEECLEMGKELSSNSTMELCTGKKKRFPKIIKLKRIKNVKSKSNYFEYIGKVTNYLGMGRSKYDFYLGGTDSCQGEVTLFFLTYTNKQFRILYQGTAEDLCTGGTDRVKAGRLLSLELSVAVLAARTSTSPEYLQESRSIWTGSKNILHREIVSSLTCTTLIYLTSSQKYYIALLAYI